MKKLAAIGAYKLSAYLNEHGFTEIFERFGSLLDRQAKAGECQTTDLYRLTDDASPQSIREKRVIGLCGGNTIAETALELVFLRLMDESTAELMHMLSEESDGYATLEAAVIICGYETFFDCEGLVRDAYKKLERIVSVKEGSENISRRKLYADEILESYMSGELTAGDRLSGHTRFCMPDEKQPEAFGFEEDFKSFAESTAKYINELERSDDDEDLTVFITGQKESGRRTALSRLDQRLLKGAAIVDHELFEEASDRKNNCQDLNRLCLLFDLIPCIYGIPKKEGWLELIKDIRRMVRPVKPVPLVFICDSGVKALPHTEGHVISLDIAGCDSSRSYEIWKGFLELAGLDGEIDADELASKMNLTAGQIKRIVDLIKTANITGSERLKTSDVYKLCYQVLDDGRYDSIKRVESSFKLEDVKTDDLNKKMLAEICDQVRNRRKVYTTWGMSEKYEYGRCVSCILSGPPGTGKTMAVRALSSELGLELFKVDLSQIVDKYIGETEKRLEEVFTKAEKSNMILFFDEADAIMGRRTETLDAKDKYANTEIAYILQRIEEYDGIVILATNYLQNIDPAFMRRIRYVINFEIPDTATRKEIWRSSFAPAVPLAAGIDWDYLAETFRFSGGSIKSIVLNAVFLAAAEDQPVDMKHLIKAVMRENNKDKRLSFVSDFGKYGHLAKY